MLALALYSMLPVLRNTVIGLRGIEPSILEAAEGVGMTPLQSLISVELPLALPVMMAGIRTAAVWVIGTATLSTPIGQTSLGNYIFAGLQTQNWVLVLFGCAAAALLALAVDQLLALIEAGLAQPPASPRDHRRRRNRRRWSPQRWCPRWRGRRRPMSSAPRPLPNNMCSSALIAQRLSAAGLSATTREGLGSNVIYQALVNGDIDVYVDYSGTLWANQFHHSDIKPRQELVAELKTELARQKVTLVGELGFENAYALVMPKKRAEALGIHTLADLAARAPTMSIAARLRVFLAAGMGGAAQGLWAEFPPAAADAAGFHVCGGRMRTKST